jgi:cytochrome c oxidase subunit II
MVDSHMVLIGQTIIYTLYVLAILALMGWFAYRVTRDGKSKAVKPAFFYSFVGLLILIGVSLHFITYNTIPWAPLDMNRDSIRPDKTFVIRVADHRFQLPADKLLIDCHDKVLFHVTSGDLTYGFGLFRPDHSMVLQMQVVPGHDNDILWQFDKPGVYSIHSTEYSGPAGFQMTLKDAVEVRCKEK